MTSTQLSSSYVGHQDVHDALRPRRLTMALTRRDERFIRFTFIAVFYDFALMTNHSQKRANTGGLSVMMMMVSFSRAHHASTPTR